MAVLAWLLSPLGRMVMIAAAVLTLLTASHWKAYQAGVASERAAILSRSVEILRERAKTDETIHDLDDAALCRALGGSVSDDGACL